jgi:hypothetical protein
MAKYDGITITLAGKDYVAPPMNLRTLQKFAPQLGAIMSGNGAETLENVGAIIEVVHACLIRNYPDLTIDDVADMLDVANMKSAIEAVMNITGIEPQGKAKAAL